ncbi:MAG: hypothetical protein HY963_07920 [Ignavibacteriales bacterium]|nr:hypothetical protein [Ignavibacteriales bacterium]
MLKTDYRIFCIFKDYSSNPPEERSFLYYEHKYDTENEVEEDIHYSTDGKIEHRFVDDNKNNISRRESYGEETEIIKFIYDENDNLIEQIDYDENWNEESRTIFIYNEEHNLIRQEYFSKNKHEIIEFEFDENGKQKNIEASNEDGVFHSIHIDRSVKNDIQYFYNSDGNVQLKNVRIKNIDGLDIHIDEYDSNDKLIGYEDLSYNENKELICRESFNSRGIIKQKEIFEYDDENRMLMRSLLYYSNEMLTHEKIFDYIYEE